MNKIIKAFTAVFLTLIIICTSFLCNATTVVSSAEGKNYNLAAKETADNIVFGDIDGSGTVNASDALIALLSSVSKIKLTEKQLIIANVDDKNSVTSNDALFILQYSVGLKKLFPAQFKGIDDIMFIGNSLTYFGEIPQKLNSLTLSNIKAFNIMDKTVGGYKLTGHLGRIRSGLYAGDIEKTDIVILQEYGAFEINTANAITEIQKYFKPGTKFYYLLTEMDLPYRLEELKDVENITYIPSGYVHNLLLNDGFTYQQLHMPNDFHPNSLYGYIAALTVYSVVFNTSCIGLRYDFLDSKTVALIPGNTKAEKDKTIAKIQKTVMQAIQTDPSVYSQYN